MFNLDRIVGKFYRKLLKKLTGTRMEADIPTMVALYRAAMAEQALRLTAAKGWLNDNGTEQALHGFYMNVIRKGIAWIADGLGGTLLKDAFNAFIDQQVIIIGASFVKVDAQAMVLAVFGVPLK